MIPLIDIQDNKEVAQPIVRLAETLPGSVWQYTGSVCEPEGINALNKRHYYDLNRAAEIAAAKLAAKVSRRDITVELIIDPLIPPLSVDNARILPIVTSIAENASASVEPGPGVVTLKTWLADNFAGVDAVGRNGCLPLAIRENLTRPGFTTRVAEWDTGFGLHAAMAAAVAIAARIELLEPEGSVGFRFAIPIKNRPPTNPPELTTALIEPSQSENALLTHSNPLSFSLLGSVEIEHGILNDGIVQA